MPSGSGTSFIVSEFRKSIQRPSYAKKKKKDENIFVYAQEFMLTLNKMQNINTLMCKKFEI